MQPAKIFGAAAKKKDRPHHIKKQAPPFGGVCFLVRMMGLSSQQAAHCKKSRFAGFSAQAPLLLLFPKKAALFRGPLFWWVQARII